MSSNWPATAMLACVSASPEAVARHDKAAWLNLFTVDAEVHDPVGAKAHHGPVAIDRFYDTFIAPNAITFEVAHELVCGDVVVRDVTIHTRMGTGLRVSVPAHLRYQLAEDATGALRIRRLCAYWELGTMVRQSLGGGLRGLRTHLGLSRHMLACQGVSGVVGFTKGFAGVGSAGRQSAEALFAALRDGNADLAGQRLSQDARLIVGTEPDASLDTLCRQWQGLQWSKCIAAGRYVTASLQHGDRQGLAVLSFNRQGRISQLRFEI